VADVIDREDLPTNFCPRNGKARYPTEHAARVALAGIVIERNRGRPGVARRKETRVYGCDRCGGWHLTSQPFRPTS